MSAPVVCSIGTTEPWNVAGLGLDVRALAGCGARPVSIVAGVSAQDAAGLTAAAPVAAELVRAQFASLATAGIGAFRIGALPDAATVATVANVLAGVRVPVVYDPVLGPSAGGTFADAATRDAIVRCLLPLATIVTPNLREAAVLANLPEPAEPAAMEAAARALVAKGAHAALIKGGHLSGDAVDVLVDVDGTHAFAAPRLAGSVRGTGCLLACALAASLARGTQLRDAIGEARAFVRARIAGAVAIGGMRAAY